MNKNITLLDISKQKEIYNFDHIKLTNKINERAEWKKLSESY